MTTLVYALLISRFVIETLTEILNSRQVSTELPDEFQGVYPPEKYATAIRYQRERALFGIVSDAVTLAALLGFMRLGGFEWVDSMARSLDRGPIVTGLVFAGALALLQGALSLPFSVYSTFVIEQKYGFNKTTPATFVGDLLKGIGVGAVLGAIVFSGILWFFESTGELAWLYAWIAVTLFQVALMYIAPVVLMPLFNKFSPLKPGELKESIEGYARKEGFQLSGIFTMDGSKRSTKANAFFTGFGRFRRLVLFDTLIEKQSVSELTAVVAHEVGHFKLKHIIRTAILSFATMAAVFFSLRFLLNDPGLFEAFGMSRPSVYASLILISIFYGPILRAYSVLGMALSRKHEYEADTFAVKTFGHPEELVSALKKLSVENLSNLKPHPLKVLLDYTHPPILLRIAALRGR